MALTEDETFGEVIAGFVTDLDGNLSVTEDDSDATWREGFLRDLDGRLIVAQDTGIWQDGFLRTAGGALCVTTDEPTQDGAVVAGFPTDDDGYICVANDGTPAASDLFPGFMFDSGKLCVTGLSGNDPGAAIYSENFDTDDGGWVAQGDGAQLARSTDEYRSAPASLRLVLPVGDAAFVEPEGADSYTSAKGEFWAMAPDWQGGAIAVLFISGGETGGADFTPTDTWAKVTVTVPIQENEDRVTLGLINLEASASAASELFIDDVTVEVA